MHDKQPEKTIADNISIFSFFMLSSYYCHWWRRCFFVDSNVTHCVLCVVSLISFSDRECRLISFGNDKNSIEFPILFDIILFSQQRWNLVLIDQMVQIKFMHTQFENKKRTSTIIEWSIVKHDRVMYDKYKYKNKKKNEKTGNLSPLQWERTIARRLNYLVV